MIIGKKEFTIENRPYIMGILNVTPDSFSDGGSYSDTASALKQVKKMMDAGVDIVDVGGESTKPGYTQISVGEEIERTCFVIEAIKENFNIPVSIDTYKSRVAQAGILAGADMVNDIWGLRYDEDMAEVIANAGVACCLMHNRENTNYCNLIEDMVHELNISLDIAKGAGIASDKIVLDPGIGFGKTHEQNLQVMKNLSVFCAMGYPVLLGASRKSMIGKILDLPVDEREEGTIATSIYGYTQGISFFRVHNVQGNYRALKTISAITKTFKQT